MNEWAFKAVSLAAESPVDMLPAGGAALGFSGRGRQLLFQSACD